MDRLPRRLLVVGVEAAQFELGADLSAPVRAAVDRAAEIVTQLLRAQPEPTRDSA